MKKALLVAAMVALVGCEESDSEKRVRVIGEIIESKVSKICMTYHASDIEGQAEAQVKVLMRHIKACKEIGRLASEDRAPTIAAFGMAGVLALSDKNLESMFLNYNDVYVDRQMEEMNSLWSGVKRAFDRWFQVGGGK